MKTHTINKNQVIRQWHQRGIVINPPVHTIELNGEVKTVEPLVMELLMQLLEHPNEVISKARLMDRLWPDRCVNEEALTKLVSKLRQALKDDPKQPRYIKTIPKKGYLLLADQTNNPAASSHQAGKPLVLGLGLVLLAAGSWMLWPATEQSGPVTVTDELDAVFQKAESHYYQYNRLDNESAIKLYARIIARDDNHALSQSGLANALVQRVLRWPDPHAPDQVEHVNLSTTLASGRLDSAGIRAQLDRARGLAERAVRLAPDNGRAHRSLGLVYAVQKKFDLAEKQYRTAIELDPDEWGAMINLSEIHTINDQPEQALQLLINAHQAMTRTYPDNEVIIRPWYAELAATIASRHRDLGSLPDAEIWFRRALETEPFHETAMRGLMAVLNSQGHHQDAAQLCFELQQKIDPETDCQ